MNDVRSMATQAVNLGAPSPGGTIDLNGPITDQDFRKGILSMMSVMAQSNELVAFHVTQALPFYAAEMNKIRETLEALNSKMDEFGVVAEGAPAGND